MKALMLIMMLAVSNLAFAQKYDSISEEDIFICNHILSVAPSVAPESVECIRIVRIGALMLSVGGDYPVQLKDISETLIILIENYPSMRAVYLEVFNG